MVFQTTANYAFRSVLFGKASKQSSISTINKLNFTPNLSHKQHRERSVCLSVASSADTSWYFAYGSDTNRFCLEQWGIYPVKISGAAVQGHTVRFSAPGVSEVFEPALPSLEEAPGQLAYGALLEVFTDCLPRLCQGDSICEVDRTSKEVSVVTYDGRRVKATTFVSRDKVDLDFISGVEVSGEKETSLNVSAPSIPTAHPSSRLAEVLIEAARLLGHDPKHIHGLESIPVYTPSPLLPPLSLTSLEQKISCSQLAEATTTSCYMAVCGYVFDITSKTIQIGGGRSTRDFAGKDATVFLLHQFYVPDLASRNPDHWPLSPTTRTPAEIIDDFFTAGVRNSMSDAEFVPPPPETDGVLIVNADLQRSLKAGPLGSRQLDVLAGWIRHLSLHFQVVGCLISDDDSV